MCTPRAASTGWPTAPGTGISVTASGKGSLAAALHRGTYAAMAITIVAVAILTPVMFNGLEGVDNSWGLVISVVTGLLVGWLIGQISEWYTSDHHKVVKEIARHGGPVDGLVPAAVQATVVERLHPGR